MERAQIAFVLFAALAIFAGALHAADPALHLTLRSRDKAGDGVVEKKTDWDTKKTALIICDMWDDHWCKGAAARVSEMAPAFNEMVKAARAKGVFIIHAPSSVTNFYKDTPQ